MIHMRMSPGDPRLYSVERDVAHNFPYIGRVVANRLIPENWDVLLADYLRQSSVAEADLGEGMAAFARFFNETLSSEISSMREALTHAGWFNLKPAVQLAICAVLGQAMMGVYFQGIRDATVRGSSPPVSYRDLERAAGEACRILQGGAPRGDSA